MVSESELISKIKELMNCPERIRNIGIVAHIDHGKTTVSDSLLAGAGMLSEEIAGSARALDYLEEEQQRGITIQAAAVSMIHNYEGNDYLINLIDTPGHVDFGGEVTRAMRAIDGAIVIVDAVEGVMPQTETVIRQALKEYVKPILFINKVDRLIKELELGPQEMQQRLAEIIKEVNKLIYNYAPEEFKEKWMVRVDEGSVAFGSGLHKWAVSVPYMKKTGITFKEIYDAYKEGDPSKIKELFKKAPLHVILLDMVVKHLPNPIEAQKYRIPHIWKGDINSEVGKALLNADPKGPLMILITKVIVDPQAGELAIGRIYSGTVKQGSNVYLLHGKKQVKINQLYVAKGPKRLQVDEVKAGNIVGIAGIKGISVGEVISDVEDIQPFEEIKHIFEPVVTVAVEPENPRDLARLLQALRSIEKEYYPDVKVEINEKTGEYLIHAQGELHVEWLVTKIRKYMNIPIKVSPPVVVYRETVTSVTPQPQEGKSPNKHNKLYVIVEPLEDELFEAIRKGDVPEGRVRKKDFWRILEKYGMEREQARRVVDIYNGNVLVDETVGVVHIGEIIEMVIHAFEELCRQGPLAREPMAKVKVRLVDAILHDDAIHRGPAQIIPAMRQAIIKAFLNASPTLLEPIQRIRIDTKQEFVSNVTRLISSRRGRVVDIEYKGSDYAVIIADVPVAELIGFTSALRSVSQGRAAWFRVDQYYSQIPKDLFMDTVKSIRKRKGLPEEIRIEIEEEE